jgi:ubiquinone biosynthesis protein
MQLNDLRKLKRFKEIVTILSKYGFEEIAQRVELPGAGLVRKIHTPEKDVGIYTRIRWALEELGPTFVKFGQIMSLRPDLAPKKLLRELEKLQDDVPRLALTDIEAVVQKNLGQPIDDVFSVFDVEPIAAASLSQVHKGVLKHEGYIVSIKVQRPGIKRMIQADLDILETLVTFLDQQSDELQAYDLPELVQVIRRHMMTELDFKTEMRNMNIARAFAADTPIYVPQVYETYCTDQLLVMEFVQGARYSEIVQNSIYDGERIAKQGLATATKQILEDGFFHADPHPGNLLVTEKMNLSIIDWGMVGRLTEKDRFELTELLRSIVDKDSDALMHSLLRLCQPRGDGANHQSMERDLLTLLDTYHAIPIKEMNVGQFLMDVMSMLRDHGLRLPTDYVIMVKALVTAEGSARQVYPDLNVVTEIGESVKRLEKSRFKPQVIWRNLRNSMANLWAYQRELPRTLQQIINKLDRGDLELQLNHNKLEQLAHALENASNRLTMAVITGAIIMGSSMIITTGIGPYLFGFPALGVIGYLLSVILGLWLILAIVRGRKY